MYVFVSYISLDEGISTWQCQLVYRCLFWRSHAMYTVHVLPKRKLTG